METRDPQYQEKVRRLFTSAAFMRDLGVEVESIEPGACSTILRVLPRHLQQDGFVHAGVQAAMADHTAGGAAGTLVRAEETVLTIEYKVNLLRPARGQLLRCHAKVLRPGSVITVVEAEVTALGSGDERTLTAKSMVTLAVVPRAAASEALHEETSTKDGYDRWSAIYDEEENPLLVLEEPEVDRLLGDVRGLEVADIGCGTGRHAIRLAQKGARVTGIDFSEGMLAKARAKAAALASPPTFVVHDVGQPFPLADHRFDRVLCALVLDHISDLAPFFAELARITKPGGQIVATVMHPAMMLRGVEARFRDPGTNKEVRPKSYANQLTSYFNAAAKTGLRIEHFGEHAVDAAYAARSPRAAKYIDWPMLATMVLSAPRKA